MWMAARGFESWDQLGSIVGKSSKSQVPESDYVQLCYSGAAGKKNEWNEYEQVCRGLILSRTYPLVMAWPYEKFFNIGEWGMRPAGYLELVTQKVDGSLGITFWHNGLPHIATKGSFDSPHAIWATEFLQKNYTEQMYDRRLFNYTLMFEIITPRFRNVIDYGDYENLVLLGARHNETGAYMPYYPNLYEIGNDLGFDIVETESFHNVTSVIEASGTLPPDKEGWVLQMSSGQRWKIKGDDYVELHRIVHHISMKRAIESLEKGTHHDIIENGLIPEEHLKRWRAYINTLLYTYDQIKNNVNCAYDDIVAKSPIDDRKAFALLATNAENKKYSSMLFAILDNKRLEPLIFKMIRKMYAEGQLDWAEKIAEGHASRRYDD
jgi:RNA ligase